MLNVDVGGEKGRDRVKGWMTLDVRGKADFVHDLNSGNSFPFADGEASNFYCSHTLEHVRPLMLSFVMGEFYRCLGRKGRIRIVVPDVGLGIKWYLTCPNKLMGRKHPKKSSYYPDTKLGWLLCWFQTENKGRMDGHHIGFDWEMLEYCLKTAHFRGIKRMAYRKCSPVFKGKDKIRYEDFSLFVEAKK